MNDSRPKWCKFHLTYSLTNFYPNSGFSVEDQEKGLIEAFKIWSSKTKFTFEKLPSTVIGDINIRWETFDRGLYGYATCPLRNCENSYDAGLIKLNDIFSWTLDLRDNSEPPVDYITLCAHEIGHALGISHNHFNSSLMSPIYAGSFRKLGDWDIQAYQWLYEGGEKPESIVECSDSIKGQGNW